MMTQFFTATTAFAAAKTIAKRGSFYLRWELKSTNSGYNPPMKKVLPLLLVVMVVMSVPAFASHHHNHHHHHSGHHHSHHASE